MSSQVQLEPVSQQHAPAIQALVTSHPDIVEFTRLPDPYPENGAKEWIQFAVSRTEKGEEYSFVIINENEQVVGTCGLTISKEEDDEAELGYWVGQKFWNQGFATAAVREALKFAFEQKGIGRVIAQTLVRNKASCRVLEKNAFRHIQTQQNTNPEWRETDQIAVYEITYEEW